MENLLFLKSGSDIRGTALGEDIELTVDIAKHVGNSYVDLLSKRYNLEKKDIVIAIARDSRLTGEALAMALAEGIGLSGAKSVLFGMSTTPSMYHCLIHEPESYTASIMVTASHHPMNKNGFKFFTKDGGLSSKDIESILKKAEENIDIADISGEILKHSYLDIYKNSLKFFVCQELKNDNLPLQHLHVVVDAGNGAGGFYAKMLQELGADTNGSQFLEPDGHFANHSPNPENAEAMQSISRAVLKSKADLGVIFDADCDRAAIVDSEGKEINRNRLIALISSILLESNKGITIVTDSVTSTGLAEFITAKGGLHHRFKRGYRNVIDEAIRLNSIGIDAPLAIETSGHCAFRENYYIDDGMFLATRLIIKAMIMKKSNMLLSDIIKDLREAVESEELRLSINSTNFRAVGERIIRNLHEYAKAKAWNVAEDNHEGVRIYFDIDNGNKNAWFLLRLSVHDPVMPVNIESDVAGGNSIVKKYLLEALINESVLDLSVLR